MIRVRFAAGLGMLMFLGVVLASGSPAEAASPIGSWRGQWSSQSTGHSGPLRARIRAVDGDTYRAVYAGRFAGVIPFVYPATLERVPGTSDLYTTTQRLPLLGTYRMTARITPSSFNATYHAKRDTGRFVMSRSGY